MQPIRSKLEDLARKAKARMPSAARGVLQRFEDVYRARRSQTPPAEPVTQPAAEPAAPAPRTVSWELRSQAELVEHIEQHYHAGLRRDLPTLIDAARRVEREHPDHPHAPIGLAGLLESFASDLESHMLKEERMLFPTLRTGARGGSVGMPIRMMEREHDGHSDELDNIRQLTHDLIAPADASPAWNELYTGLTQLEADLRQHIYLENNILFARAIGGDD